MMIGSLYQQRHVTFRYLHEVCSPSIVHKNFKSANILLDAELNPHLSECGLAGFIPNLDYQVTLFFHDFVKAWKTISLFLRRRI